MLALLESIGAPPAVLFRIVSTTGLILGVVSALVSIIAGLVIGYLWLGPAATRAPDAQINPLVVVGIALVSVVLGWATSVIPAIRAASLDVNRVLRGTPKPVSGTWATGRIGRILMLVGFGMLLIAGAVTLLARTLVAAGNGPGFFGGVAFGLVYSALIQLGPLIAIVGVLLNLPGGFRLIGRLLARFGAAPRLAARDAERNWGRSVPAAASIMVATFVIGSYLTSFGANAVLSEQTHHWSLQQGQVSVGLIDPGFNGCRRGARPDADRRAGCDRGGAGERGRPLRGAHPPWCARAVLWCTGRRRRGLQRAAADGVPRPAACRIRSPPPTDRAANRPRPGGRMAVHDQHHPRGTGLPALLRPAEHLGRRRGGPGTHPRRRRRQRDAGGVHLRRRDRVRRPVSGRKRHRHDLLVRRAVRPGERTGRVPSGGAAAAFGDGAGTPRATGTPARLRRVPERRRRRRKSGCRCSPRSCSDNWRARRPSRNRMRRARR